MARHGALRFKGDEGTAPPPPASSPPNPTRPPTPEADDR